MVLDALHRRGCRHQPGNRASGIRCLGMGRAIAASRSDRAVQAAALPRRLGGIRRVIDTTIAPRVIRAKCLQLLSLTILFPPAMMEPTANFSTMFLEVFREYRQHLSDVCIRVCLGNNIYICSVSNYIPKVQADTVYWVQI